MQYLCKFGCRGIPQKKPLCKSSVVAKQNLARILRIQRSAYGLGLISLFTMQKSEIIKIALSF